MVCSDGAAGGFVEYWPRGSSPCRRNVDTSTILDARPTHRNALQHTTTRHTRGDGDGWMVSQHSIALAIPPVGKASSPSDPPGHNC
jgi:hypothetical protein